MTTTARDRIAFTPQTGLSAIETMISLVVLVAIIVLAGGAATSITSLQRQSQSRLQAERTARTLLGKLREELLACTQEKDPLNDLNRYESRTDAEGRSILRFQVMTGSHMEGGELVPDWSSWIEYRVESNGVVTRTADGATMTVATGVDRLQLSALPSGRFEILCVTTHADTATGRTITRTDRERVMPLN